VKVQVAVLCSPSLTVLMVSVDVKQHLRMAVAALVEQAVSQRYGGSGRLGIACCQLALLSVIDKAVNWVQCFFVENEKYMTQHTHAGHRS